MYIYDVLHVNRYTVYMCYAMSTQFFSSVDFHLSRKPQKNLPTENDRISSAILNGGGGGHRNHYYLYIEICLTRK